MPANIRKLVRNIRIIQTKDALLLEAMQSLIRATNNLDSECLFCGADATAKGERHLPKCIISRIRGCLPNVRDHRAGPSDQVKAESAPVAGSGASTCWVISPDTTKKENKGV
jgi:hypothetical protein